jgi:serine/threonine protein kinase
MQKHHSTLLSSGTVTAAAVHCSGCGANAALNLLCTLCCATAQGGFGSVQICIHRASGKRFALKTIELELVKDKKSFEFFMREVEIMKNLGKQQLAHTACYCHYYSNDALVDVTCPKQLQRSSPSSSSVRESM